MGYKFCLLFALLGYFNSHVDCVLNHFELNIRLGGQNKHIYEITLIINKL